MGGRPRQLQSKKKSAILSVDDENRVQHLFGCLDRLETKINTELLAIRQLRDEINAGTVNVVQPKVYTNYETILDALPLPEIFPDDDDGADDEEIPPFPSQPPHIECNKDCQICYLSVLEHILDEP